jgi:hypothetical protein
VAVIVLLAGKLDPEIVTVSPTWPLVAERLMVAVATVALSPLSAPVQLFRIGVIEYFQLPAGTLFSVQERVDALPLIVVLHADPGVTALPPAAGYLLTV